ncbi:phosphatidylinositol phosphate synthase [Dermatophilus congolensis]|uniref:Phosphatidylinositol phosphate synthase n=1 Tax=Dermatophilus congolensis TaxID=1863 RepID=A0A239VKZ4_9MICO|nr:CDP-alcohol phosphatidyltransferase family protein [Dermatophilus congolensis]MBO3129355.1 CDP-alcohol phosphatidyltransferase family protein [Dermatophilus congolensis]MBO3132012.1 CDP-alcohol phosphatidyltransferase family protein [Dermatophilus congolensis]MBO3133832.1 CDP-alcohol phosphatidyltransferase family protein [Dermatophilus congolensis]MBO3136062.1 CDP-alcohol phosphatidyltransferase family protein [Dermatophilus congolensis]MBO3138306.1 CDP-alcohol phosphatidyltransferase fami
MLNKFARSFATKIATPIAKILLRIHLSADAVTTIGALGVCTGALWFFPRGEFAPGVLFITFFVLFDLLDGTMARLSGTTSTWGAFLDSTLDRLADGAVFGGLLLYYARQPHETSATWASLFCLVFAFVTSYARARAEGLGMTGANIGIAERADRLLITLAGAFIVDIANLPSDTLGYILWALAAASALTVWQRMHAVAKEIEKKRTDHIHPVP